MTIFPTLLQDIAAQRKLNVILVVGCAMAAAESLRQRDCELLTGLALKVRLISLRQLACHFWRGEIANARRRARQLIDAGFLASVTVLARPLPIIREPVITWKPGDREPYFGAEAHRLQQRWKNRPARPCSAYVATERCARLFGGKGRGEVKHLTQATHDLGVAEVWLVLRETQPALAEQWRSEDVLAHTRRGEKCPDAFLVQGEQTIAVVEFGGAYHSDRLQDFHHDCASRNLPYYLF